MGKESKPILNESELQQLRSGIETVTREVVIPSIEAQQTKMIGLTTRNDIKFR